MAERMSPVTRFPVRVLAAAMLALAAPAARAQDTSGIEVSAVIEPATATVGDVLRYVLAASVPAGGDATFPAARGNTGRLEAGPAVLHRDTLPDGRLRITQTILLTAWEPGPDTLPPQRVEARTAAGDVVALETPATVVDIVPVATSGADDTTLADIYDRDRLPRGFPWALPPALITLALAAWWWWRRRNRPRATTIAVPGAPREPVRTPEEVALAELDALERSGLAGRAFAFRLSEIQRAHLAAARGIDALEATSTELLERCARAGLPDDVLADLRELCTRLDAVKFASAPHGAGDAARDLAAARALVSRCAAKVLGHEGTTA